MTAFSIKLNTSSKNRAERLRQVREDIVRLGRPELSKRSGIPLNTLQNWEQSRNKGLTEKGAKRLIKAFEEEGVYCALEWLLYGVGPPPSSPFLLSSSDLSDKKAEDIIIAKELALFRQLNAPVLDTIVKDEGMFPSFWRGDYVAGTCYHGKAIKKMIDLPCIIETTTGLFVRVLKSGRKANTYSLHCINNSVEPMMKNINVVRVAPILWLRRRRCRR